MQNFRRVRPRVTPLRRPASYAGRTVLDSTGPNGARAHGDATQVSERYVQMGRDAQASGDRVLAENFFQHADHYFRLTRGGDYDPSYAAPPEARPQRSFPVRRNLSRPEGAPPPSGTSGGALGSTGGGPETQARLPRGSRELAAREAVREASRGDASGNDPFTSHAAASGLHPPAPPRAVARDSRELARALRGGGSGEERGTKIPIKRSSPLPGPN